VPSCPEWTVAELVGHTGHIHRWVTALLDLPPGESVRRRDLPGPPEDDAELGPWFLEGLDLLTSALASMDPDRPAWTFTGERPRRWWARRMAHETSVHRWDTQAALGEGEAERIDAPLAADGIDELLEVYPPLRFDTDAFVDLPATIHLHATDSEGEWVIRVSKDRVAFDHAHEKGDVAARGPVSDLLLFLWGRSAPDTLETFGDSSLLEAWQRAARF
jgi:uncharacterized protein (TIGR03083 family)